MVAVYPWSSVSTVTFFLRRIYFASGHDRHYAWSVNVITFYKKEDLRFCQYIRFSKGKGIPITDHESLGGCVRLFQCQPIALLRASGSTQGG